MFLPTGGVFGGNHHHFDFAIGGSLFHGGNGEGLVVFDADQHFFRFHQPGDDLQAFHDFIRPFPHQAVVRGDVRFAFHRIQDQRFDLLVGFDAELDHAGETRAAHTGNTGRTNAIKNVFLVEVGVIVHTVVLDPLVLAVRGDFNTERIHTGRVLNRA